MLEKLSMDALNLHEKELAHWLWKSRFGSLSAYDQLVGHFQKPILTLTTVLTGDEQMGEKVALEIFVHVFRELNRKPRREKFSTWLYRQALNQTLKRLPAFLQSDHDLIEKVQPQRLFQRVEVGHRVVLALYELLGLTDVEIAAVLGVSVGTVRTRLQAARVKFKALLKKHDLLEAT